MNLEDLYEVFNTLEEGVTIIDEDGTLLFMNRAALKIDNLKREEAFSKNILELYPSLSEKTSTLLKTLLLGKPIIKHLQKYYNYKGQEVHTINSSYPVMISGKIKGAFEISRDITAIDNLSEEIFKLKEELFKDKHGNETKTIVMDGFHEIIGNSNIMAQCKAKAKNAANTSSPVLIYGETGTGKELFVKAIHYSSKRKNNAFIVQNCAAIPENLLEGMLFGTLKGSFTGAMERKGLFQLAHGGTLYLDELNSMPMDLQAKLLRVIQEGALIPLGGNKLVKVDVRIIASVNEFPEKLIKEAKIRSDLFYRLNVVRINLPPLRDRKEDIEELVYYYINYYNNKFKCNITGISEKALSYLLLLPYEGNVRELQHIIEAVFNYKSTGEIDIKDVYDKAPQFGDIIEEGLEDKIKKIEILSIKDALLASFGNVSQAARILKIPRQTLQAKIKKYNLSDFYRTE